MKAKSKKSKAKCLKKNPYQKRKHVAKRVTKKVTKRKIVKMLHTETSCTESSVPRKRGRPKKDTSCVLNKAVSIESIDVTNKKRGRPKKVFSYDYKKEEPILNKPMRTLKMAGYCPSCQLTLTTSDIIDKVFTCYKCNKSGKESELLKVIPEKEKVRSKKEYLQTIFSTNLEDNSYYGVAKVNDEKIGNDSEEEIVTDTENEIETDTETDTEINKVIDITEEVDIDEIINEVKADEEIIIENNIKNFIDNDEE